MTTEVINAMLASFVLPSFCSGSFPSSVVLQAQRDKRTLCYNGRSLREENSLLFRRANDIVNRNSASVISFKDSPLNR